MPEAQQKAGAGIWGLNDILSGGLSCGHVFLVEGAPGTGMHEVELTIGAPLDGFQGVLRGVSTFVGGNQPLLQEPGS